MMDVLHQQWPEWRVVRRISHGSFGAVYEIERTVFGEVEKAAVKVISIPEHPEEIEELRREGYTEAAITARYSQYLDEIGKEYTLMEKMKGHTNVVYCSDVRRVRHDDGIGWDILIKMELLTPVMDCLERFSSEEEIVRLGVDLCNALALCRKRNILHRDIKPQNILLSQDGDYKLGDFGVARTFDRISRGTKVGTYNYMAPEVYNNQPYGHTADIYSLGLVLYWLLNEKRMPFVPLPPQMPTDSMEQEACARRFRGEPIPPPAHGSPVLKAIVCRACAADPGERYPTADEMRDDLEALLASQRAPAEHWTEPKTVPTPPAQSGRQTGKKRGLRLAVLLSAVLALAVGVAVFALRGKTVQTDESANPEAPAETAETGALPDPSVLSGQDLSPYVELLSAHTDASNGRFLLTFLDGDEVPELLLCLDSFHFAAAEIYTIADGEAVSIGYYGLDATILCACGKGVFVQPGDRYFNYYAAYRFSDGSVERTLYLSESPREVFGEDQTLVYTVDEAEVGAEEYAARLSELYAWGLSSLGWSDGWEISAQNIERLQQDARRFFSTGTPVQAPQLALVPSELVLEADDEAGYLQLRGEQGIVFWYSSDASVVTVEGGKLTPVGPGEAVITACNCGQIVTCTVRCERGE